MRDMDAINNRSYGKPADRRRPSTLAAFAARVIPLYTMKIRDSLGFRTRRWCYKFKVHSSTRITKVLDPYNNNIYKMVLPHHTPYVTPHILHKHYAQAHDNDQYSQRMFFSEPFIPHPHPSFSDWPGS